MRESQFWILISFIYFSQTLSSGMQLSFGTIALVISLIAIVVEKR